MESKFKISKIGKFGLLIEGLEYEDKQYLNEGEDITISNRNYTWSQSVTINTLATVNSNGDETFQEYYVVDHEEVCCNDRLEVQLKKDGLYRIAHIILPTKKWIDDYIDSGEMFNQFNEVYYYDNGKFYLLNIPETEDSGEIVREEIEFKTIYDEFPGEENTIIRSDMKTFAMHYLNDCFSKLLKNILKGFSKDECNTYSSTEHSKKVADRDMMWMFINSIKYSLSRKEFYEAQRFLEKFNRCNVICDYDNLKFWNNDCGC